MTHEGYAFASPAGTDWTDTGSNARHVSFTGRLGCSHTHVGYYRFQVDGRVTLPTDFEALCVPFGAAGELISDGARTIPRRGIARVPAGVACAVRGEPDTTMLVVSAPAKPSSETVPVVLDTDELAFTEPTTSDVLIARLTAPLDCRRMKVNVRLLRPGDAVPYHTEGSQEELFVPLDGPGVMRVAGRTHSLDAGDVARVAPDVPRGAVNETDEAVRWLMVGAPPTGGAEEWDPGAEILEWPHTD